MLAASKEGKISERGFDPLTCALWGLHSSTELLLRFELKTANASSIRQTLNVLIAYDVSLVQEGADMGLLRAAPFKTLNVGLIAIGVANWSVLLPWWIHHHEGAESCFSPCHVPFISLAAIFAGFAHPEGVLPEITKIWGKFWGRPKILLLIFPERLGGPKFSGVAQNFSSTVEEIPMTL